MTTRKFLSVSLTALLLAAALPGCKRTTVQKPGGIFSVTDEKGTTDAKGPEVIASVNVKVDIRALPDDKNMVFELPLPDKRTIKLERKRLDTFGKGRYAWYGIVNGDPGSFVLLSVTDKAIAGKITTGKGEIYTINYIGKGLHRIDQINPGELKERPNDDIEVKPTGNGPEKEGDCPDPSSQVDIMVVYTEAAETEAGGPEGIEAFIYLCVYFTNLSYQNSNVNLTMNLVHMEKVTYTETGVSDTDLDRLRGTADGFMDNVHTLRDAHGADLVSLITETLDNCGLAYRLYPVTAGFESSAFSVVKRTCAAAGLSFAHETSHNMGARHDCGQASNSAGPNHGHFVSDPADGSGQSWRTVLSYTSCTDGPCTRIPYFSNPTLSYSPTGSAATDPMGTVSSPGVCTNDNTSVLNAAAPIVANFRCSSPGVSNVWMRDAWADTGLEPDPATAGMDMWRSPYIWIRRGTQDPTFQHQHEHQNPKVGESHWIYVKLHNGGVAASGNLEVYIAKASVSLTWPGAWTLVNTVPVNINAATTQIVEIPWNSLPGDGHYCMVARWVSAADPIAGETADIGANTRNSNNIIWRNLNIEEMDADEDEKVETFQVQSNGERSFSIRFRDEALWPKPKFTATGRVFIEMDKNLYAAWKKGGAKGTGIRDSDNRVEIVAPTATLDNITLQTREPLQVIIRFVKTKNTISDRYSFTVEQTDAKGNASGGVSYEIYTYKR